MSKCIFRNAPGDSLLTLPFQHFVREGGKHGEIVLSGMENPVVKSSIIVTQLIRSYAENFDRAGEEDEHR